MANPSDLTRLVPGFDFLQNLMKGAGAGIPGMGQWIAPTLNPEELEKRISELKTVQFWLENNARLLATTIQALEVQRMTLNTLQTMNLPLADLRDALRINLPKSAAPAEAAAPAPASPTTAAQEAQVEQPSPGKAQEAGKKAASGKTAGGGGKAQAAIDPMQWWGALTQQFTELATNALKDGAAGTARSLAGAAVKQAGANVGRALKKAASVPGEAASPSSAGKRRSAPAAKKRSR